MWKLEVSHNMVSSIPSMAFYGLERALWELHLPHNKLTRIPSDSLTLLKKLSVLNLAGKFSFLPDGHVGRKLKVCTALREIKTKDISVLLRRTMDQGNFSFHSLKREKKFQKCRSTPTLTHWLSAGLKNMKFST